MTHALGKPADSPDPFHCRELGKGFAFVARQGRFNADGDEYRIDLLLHNLARVLRGGSALILAVSLTAYAHGAEETNETRLIASFDHEMIGPYGVSDSNPMDRKQGIKMSFVEDNAFEKQGGRALRIDYDVDSDEPAKVEFWLKLREMDLSRFDALNLYLRGHAKPGTIRGVTIRIVDANHRAAPYILTGIEDRWKEFRIPFKRFSRIRDWSRIEEFGILFDDVYSKPKEGTLLVDEIFVSKKDGR